VIWKILSVGPKFFIKPLNSWEIQIIPIFAPAIFSGNVKEGKQDIFPEDPQFVYHLYHQYFTRLAVAWTGWSVTDQWTQYPETGHGKYWFQCDPEGECERS
jgi:hypothetical protein